MDFLPVMDFSFISLARNVAVLTLKSLNNKYPSIPFMHMADKERDGGSGNRTIESNRSELDSDWRSRSDDSSQSNSFNGSLSERGGGSTSYDQGYGHDGQGPPRGRFGDGGYGSSHERYDDRYGSSRDRYGSDRDRGYGDGPPRDRYDRDWGNRDGPPRDRYDRDRGYGGDRDSGGRGFGGGWGSRNQDR